MEEFNVFQLETKRIFVCKGDPIVHGKARLIYPDGKVVVISGGNERPVERKDNDDDVWEQRVIGWVVGFLRDRGYRFLCLTDASEHPIRFSDRIWMIVTERTD